MGRGLHSALPRSGNLPRLARWSGRPGHLLGRPGAAAPSHRRNATGEHVNYCEEVKVDHRAKDPLLKALKKDIRLQPDQVQCRAMRKALPGCLGWERFVEAWKPCYLILTSRQKVRDRAQRLLFERYEKYFPDTSVPLLYRPKDTRRQNIMVTIPGPSLLDGRPDQEELILNDVVQVGLKYAREVLDGKWGQDWALGYALTVHSSQGLTVADPQKVWIIDDYLQWSNRAYLAISRVEYLSQLERVVCPSEEGSEGGPLTEPDEPGGAPSARPVPVPCRCSATDISASISSPQSISPITSRRRRLI